MLRIRTGARLLVLLVAIIWLSPATSYAQGKPSLNGVLALGTGLEGADPGYGTIVWQRARTRLITGAEWTSQETTHTTLGLYGMFELERSGSFGAEFFYRRWLNSGFGVFLGPSFIWRPKTLLGVHSGLSYRLQLGDPFALVGDLGFAAFPIGSDRPQNDAIVMWSTLDIGLRLAF